MHKIDNSWEHTVWHRELYLTLCRDPNGKEVQEGGDTCVCMADAVFYAVKSNPTLCRNYTTTKN